MNAIIPSTIYKTDQEAFKKVAINALKNTNGVVLKEYQMTALSHYIWKQELYGKGGILADEMGCGKTYTMCAAIATNPMGRTLLMVPVSLVCQWEVALAKWNITCITINNADTSFPQAGPSTAIRVFLTTHSCLTKKNMHVFYTSPVWDRIIIDEAHVLRNTSSLTHNNAMSLSANVRWAITATPIQNKIDDLVSLARFIRARDPEDANDVIENYMLRRTMKMIIEKDPRERLPDLISRYELFDLTQLGVKVYDKITKMVIKKPNPGLVRLIRLRLCCVDPKLALIAVTRSKSSNNALHIIDAERSPKIHWLLEDIKKQPSDVKSLIFCSWTEEINLIRSTLTAAGLNVLVFDGKLKIGDRDTVLENFKLPGFNILILQIMCGSVGLNIQTASRVYFMSPGWNPTQEVQAIARVHRQGQTKVVTCIRLVTRGTIEESIMYTQLRKSRLIDGVTKDNQVTERLLLTVDGLKFLAGGQGVAGYEEQLDEIGVKTNPLSMVAKKRRIAVTPTETDGVDLPLVKKTTKTQEKAAEQRVKNAARIAMMEGVV